MRFTLSLILIISGVIFAVRAQPGADALKAQLRIDPQGHAGVVNDLQFTPDGKSLISVSADKTIRFWDVADGSLQKTLRSQSGSGPDGSIYTGALSADGRFLAIGGYFPENEIRIIDLLRDNDVVLLKGHQNIINRLAFSKNGRLLASASADNTVKIWQLTFNNGTLQGELQQTLTGHSDQVYDLAFAPDARHLVSASADGSLRLWNLEAAATPVVMKMHVARVYSCAFSADGKYIASGGSKGKVLLWNSNGTFNSRLGALEAAVGRVDFTRDNKLFASGRNVKIFSVPAGTLVGVIPEQERNITATAVYQNKYFASAASASGKIIVRDLQNQTTAATLSGAGLSPLEVASNNKGVVAIGLKKRSLAIAFDFQQMKFLFGNFDKNSFTGAITGEEGYTLQKTDKFTLSTGFKGKVVNNPAIDGRLLHYTLIDADNIAVGSDYSIKIYSREGVFKRALKGANGAVTAMAVDRQHNYLITATTDQTVRIWNIATGENLAALFFSDKNDWICWTPKGYYQASAGGEKYLGWHVNRGRNKLADFYPAYVFANYFRQPEVVKQSLRLGNEKEAMAYLNVKEEKINEEAVKQPVQAVEAVDVTTEAPVIKWLSPETTTYEAGQNRVLIKAQIISSTPVKTVKILINGRPAPQSRGVSPTDNNMLVEQEILLLNEVNKIKLFVSNENARTVSEERVITLPKELLNGQKAASTQIIDYTAKPDLYVLGIGISDYANPEYNLTYADDDAQAITELFGTTGKGVYKKVSVDKLLNEEATKKKILNAFAWLYQNATSKDIVIITIAAHGFNKDGEFYVLPYDGDAEDLPGTGIGWHNLASTLGNIPARVLLMVDACYSGQLGTNIEHLESDNTEAVRQLSDEENGVVVMAASTGDETSVEFADWGHGAFTLSVLEGLKQGKADIKQDLTVFLRELDFYVYERTVELTSGQQHPTTQKPSSISRFPVLNIDK